MQCSQGTTVVILRCHCRIVSRASPFTREEGSGQLRIMSLCCRVSSGQAVQGVSNNSMLFAASRDAVLAGLFDARHTEYACARLVCVHSTSYYTRHLWLTRQENRGKHSQNHDAKLTRPFLRVGRGWLARLIVELMARPRLSN